MRMPTIVVAGLLGVAGLALAAPALADDVGSTPLRQLGSNPAAYCKGPLQSVCATVQTTRDDSGTFVVTVFAPAKDAIRSFDLDSGTAAKKPRPKAICSAHGTRSAPEYQEGKFFVTRCTEPIKAARKATYCFAGLGRIPSTQGASVTYPLYLDAGDAGADSVTSIPSTSKCPAGVATRKRPK